MAGKRKRRTKAEVERDEALKREDREAKMKEKEAAIRRIAELENQMAKDDANAQVSRNPPRGVRKNLALHETDDEPYLDGGSSSVYKPSDGGSARDDVEESSGEAEDELEPPKKKAKAAKVPIRRAISNLNQKQTPAADQVNKEVRFVAIGRLALMIVYIVDAVDVE
jgi:hypothetical protein